MRAYESLTPRGQLRRLGAVARAAIELWPIDVARLRFLANATSVTYRVDATDGTRYALRVARPGEMNEIQTAAEFAWLLDLAADYPELGAPRPLPTRDGRLLAAVRAEGVPGPCQCALMTWVPGVMPGAKSTVADHRRLGVLAARLHQAALTFEPPEGFQAARWDRICYFPNDEEVLFEPAHAEWVPADRVPMLKQAWRRCQTLLDDMAQRPGQRILHGDLHPWNVMRVRTRLRPLDFADLTWGPPILDIAITLYYLQSRDDYPQMREAFTEGYASILPYPADDWSVVSGLHTARELNFCNYIVRVLPSERKTLARRYDRIEKWLETYG